MAIVLEKDRALCLTVIVRVDFHHTNIPTLGSEYSAPHHSHCPTSQSQTFIEQHNTRAPLRPKITQTASQMLSPYKVAALAAFLSATVSALTDIGVPGPWGPTDSLVNIYNTGKATICYKVEFSSGHFPTTTTCDSSPGFTVAGGQSVALHTGAGFNGGITAITNGAKGARHEINFSATVGSCWYDGHLTDVYMDGEAPREVAEFFQLTAEFTGYMGAGSVAGVAASEGTVQSEMDKAADQKSWVVDTQQMEIVAY